jgi:hypothetical protein
MTLPKNEWPWTLDDAVAAKITLWDGGKLGVVYHYPDEAIQMHAIGSEDWPTIRRLKRAGKIEYQREDVRERVDALRKLSWIDEETTCLRVARLSGADHDAGRDAGAARGYPAGARA